MRDRLTYANVMATFAVVAAIGGGTFAVAAIPDRQGRINACYVKKGKKKGQVRLVTGTKCRKSETRVSWNQRGRQGTRGRQGVAGQAGAAGTARAYAVVTPTGCTAAANSCTLIQARNVVGARRPQNGFYCVTAGPGLNRVTDGFMAGVEWGETSGVKGNASAMVFARDYEGAPVCPGNEFTVATERLTTATTTTQANDVAVWFAVP